MANDPEDLRPPSSLFKQAASVRLSTLQSPRSPSAFSFVRRQTTDVCVAVDVTPTCRRLPRALRSPGAESNQSSSPQLTLIVFIFLSRGVCLRVVQVGSPRGEKNLYILNRLRSQGSLM